MPGITGHYDDYAEAARDLYADVVADGDLSFDANPTISESEHGAYVAAWVWVDRSLVTK